VGPVGFETSVRVPLLSGFMAYYSIRAIIILAVKLKVSNKNQ
jgi:hypothetical protein